MFVLYIFIMWYSQLKWTLKIFNMIRNFKISIEKWVSNYLKRCDNFYFYFTNVQYFFDTCKWKIRENQNSKASPFIELNPNMLLRATTEKYVVIPQLLYLKWGRKRRTQLINEMSLGIYLSEAGDNEEKGTKWFGGH